MCIFDFSNVLAWVYCYTARGAHTARIKVRHLRGPRWWSLRPKSPSAGPSAPTNACSGSVTSGWHCWNLDVQNGTVACVPRPSLSLRIVVAVFRLGRSEVSHGHVLAEARHVVNKVILLLRLRTKQNKTALKTEIDTVPHTCSHRFIKKKKYRDYAFHCGNPTKRPPRAHTSAHHRTTAVSSRLSPTIPQPSRREGVATGKSFGTIEIWGCSLPSGRLILLEGAARRATAAVEEHHVSGAALSAQLRCSHIQQPWWRCAA